MARTRTRPGKPGKLLPAEEIPPLATEAEAAEWYDTHDTARLPSEPTSEAETPGLVPTLETIAVRVSRREIAELKRRAERLGIGYTTYVRMLINRHVLDEPPIG